MLVLSVQDFFFLISNLESQLSTYMFDVVFKRKPRENIKVCVNVSRTSYRQVTDTLPTVGRLSADR